MLYVWCRALIGLVYRVELGHYLFAFLLYVESKFAEVPAASVRIVESVSTVQATTPGTELLSRAYHTHTSDGRGKAICALVVHLRI